jgi:queuine tRNA-ribosyltransferase
VEGVARGVDLFDCVIATRHARGAALYTNKGRIRLTDARYRKDMFPVDTSCTCYTCRNFSRAYLHHLFKVGEVLSATLSTLHNLHWFAHFMNTMRESIIKGEFGTFRAWVHEVYPEDMTPKPVAGVVAGAPKPSLAPRRSGAAAHTAPPRKPGPHRR